MRKLFLPLILFIGLIALVGCKKEAVGASFDDVFHKPYTTGIIKFQYEVPTTLLGGITTIKDTTVSFTSTNRFNPAFKDNLGYFTSSMVVLGRSNPENYENQAWLIFENISLDSLSLPYKFKAGSTYNRAKFEYWINEDVYMDRFGSVNLKNLYRANNYTNGLEVTILSKANNRLQGTFSAVVKNSRGLTINIKKGLFDIEVVKK